MMHAQQARRGATTGDTIGCVVIIVLILAGIGFWIYRSGQSDDKEAIEQVLKSDSRSTVNTTSVAAVVSRMRRIDLSKCPNDFKAVYLEHIHAWEQLADVERDATTFDAEFNSGGALLEAFIRGFMGDPFGKANEGNAEQRRIRARYQKAMTEVRETFQRVEVSAARYGASRPKKPNPGYRWVSEDPNDSRVKWTPGTPDPDHPNVVASEKEGNWKPAPGYKWRDNAAQQDMQVVPR